MNQVNFDYMNTVVMNGVVETMSISENSQHMFVAVSRKRWEIDSRNRLIEICDTLLEDPNNIFLSQYNSSCKSMNPQPINMNDFSQFATSCMPGTICPSLYLQKIESVSSGNYTMRPQKQKVCEPGNFCSNGIKQVCPQGFTCPAPGLIYPLKCEFSPFFNTSCLNFGLEEPETCPLGAICRAPYYVPSLSPQGFYADADGYAR